MFTSTITHKGLIFGLIGGILLASTAPVSAQGFTEEEKKILERSDYESIESILSKAKAATGETDKEKLDASAKILREEREARKVLSEKIAKGYLVANAKNEVAKLEAKSLILKTLTDNNRLSEGAKLISEKISQLSSDPEGWESSIEEGFKGSPLKMVWSGLKAPEGDVEILAKASTSLVLDDNAFKLLKDRNKDLFETLKRYSDNEEDQKKLLSEIAKEINDSEDIFKKTMAPSDISKIRTDSSDWLASVKNSESSLTKKISKLGSVDDKVSEIGQANSKLTKIEQEKDKITAKMARELSHIDQVIENFDPEKGIADVKACGVLSKTVYLEDLSLKDKEKCIDDIKNFKTNRKVAASEATSSVTKNPLEEVQPTKAITNSDDKKEETASSDNKDTITDERKKRMAELENQLAQDPGFAYRQLVGNLIVPAACGGEQALMQSMPFASNPNAEKKLERLEEGLAAQMTACTSTGYIDEEMMAFSSGLMDGSTLASDAMEKLFGSATASTLTTDQTTTLKSEKKCLDRSAAAMRRGLTLTKLEIARLAREKARDKIYRLRTQNPMLFSQELSRKSMQLASMGAFNPFTNEDDLTNALFDEYKETFANQLHVDRNVDQMANNLKIVQTLGVEVNQLYNDRLQYISSTLLKPSTRDFTPVSPNNRSRTAPSRARVPGSTNSGGNRTINNNQRRTNNNAPNFI